MRSKPLKPFNLEAALAGARVQTRNGCVIESIAFLSSLPLRKVVAHVGGIVEPLSFFVDGKFTYGTAESDFDLFMAYVEITKWVNLYPEGFDPGDPAVLTFFDTEEDADESASPIRLGGQAHRITYVE